MNELMLAEVPEYVMCSAIDTGNTDDLLLSESMTQNEWLYVFGFATHILSFKA